MSILTLIIIYDSSEMRNVPSFQYLGSQRALKLPRSSMSYKFIPIYTRIQKAEKTPQGQGSTTENRIINHQLLLPSSFYTIVLGTLLFFALTARTETRFVN